MLPDLKQVWSWRRKGTCAPGTSSPEIDEHLARRAGFAKGEAGGALTSKK